VPSVRSAHRSRVLALSLLAGTLLAALACATPALAANSWWRLSSGSAPTNLPPGGKAQLVVSAANLGFADAKASEAHPIVVTDTLPAGLEVVPGTVKAYQGQARNPFLSLKCAEAGQAISCSLPSTLPPYGGIEMVATVSVTAAEGASLPNEVKVEGGEGGIPGASRTLALHVAAAPTPFGVERYELAPEDEAGLPDTQAGSHPFQLTSTFALNETLETNPKTKRAEGAAPALVRDLHFVLPPGLLGNVTVVPQCSSVDFSTIGEGDVNLCAANTAVGVARVTINEPNVFGGVVTETVPVFNLTPAPGEPARFGLELDKVPITLNTAVRTGSDYAVEVSVANASQAVGVLATQLSFWGVPADPRHDAARGWECIDAGRYAEDVRTPCKSLADASPKPFLTLPAGCSTIPTTTVTGDSWPHGTGGEVSRLRASYQLPAAFDHCDLLAFDPLVSVTPDTHAASTPVGLTVKVRVPQDTTLSAGGLAEADVAATTVTLPAGVQASPAAADGLLACSGSEVGFEPGEAGLAEDVQTLAENDHFTPAPDTCPPASKIGTVTIKTPLLENELEGGVYLASQNTDPFGSPLVLYLIAQDPVSGVRVKLAGEVRIDQTTGQLTSVFNNTPPLPFEELTLNLFGGARASQSTPPLCGSYAANASFTPSSGQPGVTSSSSFAISEGAGGSACQLQDPRTFAPSFAAGSTDNQAGAFTPFTLDIEHADSDQALAAIAVHLPPGVAALLSRLTPCAEPPTGQQWACGSDSLLGYATTSSGLGGDPYSLAGEVYLTSGYGGAPFGLLVSTLAKAGPFNLGMVYVRSRINVDPNTAAVTITTDGGPHGDALPTMLKGVPVQLKHIHVAVDRPEFEFNPTSCAPMSVSGTLGGAQGADEPVSSPFQVTGCARLPFAPKLTASTNAQASKAGGAALNVRIRSAGLGQANIAKVALQLPIALPSRLSTLQKACAQAVFDANPAACGEGSNIGQATIHTPVLKSPLTGPAYLVSHGGAAFPDVEFVLQGEGIVLILDGRTDIKKGITYSRFEAAPDAPFTTFETVLPTGPHSALTAFVPAGRHFNLCGTALKMPTVITGQNGAVRQTTNIRVNGCVAACRSTRARSAASATGTCTPASCKGAKVRRSAPSPRAPAGRPTRRPVRSRGGCRGRRPAARRGARAGT
jgi:uncharacterized repeat protein (TIGR01451 family)